VSRSVKSRRERLGIPRQDDRRTAAERGYGRRWAEVSRSYRSAHPLCVECERQGISTEAALVDHKRPVIGPNDPGFYDEDNLQSLCRRCHAIKTHGERLR
jgi:5-methylcytosine-specific restriction protein A